VVQDGDALPLESRVQDVAVDFEVLDHHFHHEGAQLQGHDVRPVGLSSVQRGSRALLHLQVTPMLAGQDDELLEGGEGERLVVQLVSEFGRHVDMCEKIQDHVF